MRKYQNWWIEYGYRSRGHGFATACHNVSEESRQCGISLETLIKDWEIMNETMNEDHIGSD